MRVVPCDGTGRLDLDRLEEAVRAHRPRLLAAVHASNVTGSVIPLREIGGICRAAGALLLVDAAQSAGALPIDVEADRVDLLAFTGHKSLFGPQGTGGLWARGGSRARNRSCAAAPAATPNSRSSRSSGRTGSRAARRTPWASPACSPVCSSSRRRASRRSTPARRRSCAGCWPGSRGFPGLRMHGPDHAEERTPVVSVTFDGLFPSEAGFLLEEGFDVLTRVGLHCAPAAHRTIGTYPQGTVRFTPGYFTTDRGDRHRDRRLSLPRRRRRRRGAVSAAAGAFAIATFHSTHSVLKAEKLLKEAGLAGVRLVPVPSQVSSDCGVTVRFAAADAARAAELLRALEDDLQGIFVESAKGWSPFS